MKFGGAGALHGGRRMACRPGLGGGVVGTGFRPGRIVNSALRS
ncbi:hypothetical protein ACIHFD_67245 [Nonomuraea sp. NPDC051941]